jgi:hypothetical protein
LELLKKCLFQTPLLKLRLLNSGGGKKEGSEDFLGTHWNGSLCGKRRKRTNVLFSMQSGKFK